MRVDLLYWNSARVTCPSDRRKSLTVDRCYVEFDSETTLLWITERDAEQPRTLMYVRASIAHLNMRHVRFKGYWWSAELGGSDYKELIQVEVVCEF
jgi:hypothetical protein